MKAGEKIFGFTVKRVRPIDELEGALYELEHEKTGAQLVWLNRKEQNKTFLVGFKTLPQDDTGVFHILEHSVLCGSEKFPVKEPFVELLKTSMNTFLNAMTFPDKTVYPISSRNEADFMNLMGVYLDAVFSPAIYHNPNIFRQEGWHYEVEGPKKAPSFKGVVYNEMKGALSSVEETIETGMSRMLYPNSCYRFISGGDPVHIPDLTYQQFLDAHRKFYHPSNAKFFLDGDLPIQRVLELIDRGYLCRYQKQELDFALTPQPLTNAQEQTQEYAVSPDESMTQKAYFTMGRLAGTWEEREKMLALEALCDALTGSQDAPLKRAILQKGLGQDAFLVVNTQISQPWISFQVENTDPEHFSSIEETYYETLESIVQHGLDQKALSASLNHLEFQYRERKEPQGLILALSSLESWLYGGDPALYLTCGEAFAFLREKIGTGYFVQLIQEILLDRAHMATLKTLPSQTLNQKMEEDEKNRLEKARSSWSQSQWEQLERETAELIRWQQSPDTAEGLATLPTLKLSDVSPNPIHLQAETSIEHGVTVLRSPSAASGVVYLNLFFSLSDCPLETLPAASLLALLLGKLPTKNYTASELDRELKTELGNLSFRVSVFSKSTCTTRCLPCFVVSCSVLEEKAPQAIKLIREVVLKTKLEEVGRIREIVLQTDAALRQSVISNGERYAMLRALSHHSVESAVRETLGGFSFYQWTHAFAEHFDEKQDSFIQTCMALRDRTFCSARLTVGISGSLAPKTFEDLAASFPQGTPAAEQEYPLSSPCREGILIPSGVSYASQAGNLASLGSAYSGSLQIISAILSYQHLWNAIRVQGGAYGAGLVTGKTGNTAFYSFRDPDPMGSLRTFSRSEEFLMDFCDGDEALEPRIVGAIAGTEPLLSPALQAAAICENYFRGVTYAEEQRIRQEMLTASKENLAKLGPVLRRLNEQGSQCVVGPESAFTSCDREEWHFSKL